MPFARPSFGSALRSFAALLLAAPATLTAETLPEPHDGVTAGGAATRLSVSLPAPRRPLPDILPPRMTTGPSTLSALPSFDLSPLQFSSGIDPKGPADSPPTGFSARLMSRMSLEARRYRRDNVSESTGLLRSDRSDDLDSIAEARRNSEASRVITRSFHRALDDELERAARTTLGLGPTLDFLRGASLRGLRTGQSARADGAAPVAGSAAQRSEGLRGDIGLRLDAHPAVVLRARLGGMRGRIELPARNEPARLTVESPVGARGRAILSAATPRDGQASATLTFNFWF
ncbi:MAG TPA: hypothetical protein VKF61_04015 [Candidatus Polarisedimenticolia bacterium]|nr:hypothetical protein [Candidatus Polarisedimenticolia bacterium]